MPGLLPGQYNLLGEFQDIARRQMDDYADAWRNGDISLMEFELLFKQELKDVYIAAGWTAKGRTDLGAADYGRIGRRLRDQYGYMHEFFTEIAAGKLSEAQIKARMGLYTNSARQIVEEVGNSDVLPRLPHYPGDGSTQCRTNDQCSIEYEPVENGYNVYWRLHPAEHCPDCVRRSRQVLQVRFGKVLNPGAWD